MVRAVPNHSCRPEELLERHFVSTTFQSYAPNRSEQLCVLQARTMRTALVCAILVMLVATPAQVRYLADRVNIG